MSRIAITGGTGFVGTHTARALLDAGHTVRLIARGHRRIGPRPAGVEVVRNVDVTTGRGLEEALQGCDAVVHLTAVIVPRGRNGYDQVNHAGAHAVAGAARAAGIGHLVHISAIGAGPDPRHPYLRSKWLGEQAVRGSGVPYTVLRPSLLFGPGDGFFTRLARIVSVNRFSPMVPVVGDGMATFQPLAVRDLARVIVLAIERGPDNRVYEVGGPDQMSLDDVVRAIGAALGVNRRLVHVPAGAVMPGAWLASKVLFWNPPITPDQLRMLECQNTTEPNAVSRDWGFEPRRFADEADYLLAS